jgi:hypothetical protein
MMIKSFITLYNSAFIDRLLEFTAIIIFLIWMYFCRHWVGIDSLAYILIIQFFFISIAYFYSKNFFSFKLEYYNINFYFIILKIVAIYSLLAYLTGIFSAFVITLFWFILFLITNLVIRNNSINTINSILNILISLILLRQVYQFFIPPFLPYSDQMVYIHNGIAFIQHLRGEDVNSYGMDLLGLQASNIPVWLASDTYSFATVAGSRNYLYSLILGFFLHLNISLYEFYYINLGFIAFGIFSWGYIAFRITKSNIASNLLMILCVVDSGFMASIITLWRESLVIYLLPLLIIIINDVFLKRRFLFYWIIFGLILSITRYNLLFILSFLLIPFNCFYCKFKKIPVVKLSILISIIIFTFIASNALVNFNLSTPKKEISKIFDGPNATIKIFQHNQKREKQPGELNKKDFLYDAGIMNWSEPIENKPFIRILMDSFAATFFNPNPNWLRPSKNWDTAEFWTIPEETLLYPEMVMVIAFTPLFILGSILGFRNINTDIKLTHLLLAISLIVVVLSTILFGSFSGRHRVQLMPIFYIFVVQGAIFLIQNMRRRC